MRVALLVLVCALRALRAAAVQLVAPRCGGARLVTHASAQFGRRLDPGKVTPIRAFAPYPATSTAATNGSSGVSVSGMGRWTLRRRRRLGTAKATQAKDALGDLCGALTVSEIAQARNAVVFALRGGCDFARKAALAESAGAFGVVVVNTKHMGQLVNMKLNETLVSAGTAPHVGIPTVMIRYSDWSHVAKCRSDTSAGASGGGGLAVGLTADGEAVYDIDYGRDALNWAMMRGMALWILCQCGVNVVRYKRRVCATRARAVAIASMSEHRFGEHEDDPLLNTNAEGETEQQPVCVICQDVLRAGDVVRRLSCSHLYHKSCIDPWLISSSNTCPVCLRQVRIKGVALPPAPAQLNYGSITP